MGKKKITLVISQISGGGAERVTCNLANYLDKKGYAVDIITLSESKNAYDINDGVKEVCLLKNSERRNAVANNLLRHKRLKKYVREHLEVSGYVVMLSLPSFMLTSLKKYTNAKIIMSERCNPATHAFWDKVMTDYAVKRCDGLVVQTKEIGDWYKGMQNKVVIPNAINEDIKLPKCTHIEKRIVAVGRLEKQKNYPMLIRAFMIFDKTHPDYKLEIYGQGSQEEELKRMVKECGLADKVVFVGHVKNISERIANAVVFVMSSDYEGISNALIEAMCIGLPCISTDSDGGGARELIKDGENGILVKKGAAEDMAFSMSRIVDDEDLNEKLSRNAKKLKDKLEPDKIYSKWLEFINDTIGRTK